MGLDLKQMYEKYAEMEVPEGIDDQEREGQQLPTKTWYLGQFAPANRGDSAGLDPIQMKSGETFFNFKFTLHPIGAEGKVKEKDGPFTPLFGKISPHGWDEEKGGTNLELVNPRLMGLMNAVLSTEFPHGDPARWKNTVGALITKANEVGADPSDYISEACFLAAMFGQILNATTPRLLFKVSARKAKDKNTGEALVDASGNQIWNYNLGDFADATDAGIAEKKIVEWKK